MPAKKKESLKKTAAEGKLKETGIRVGKALAKTSFVVEDTGRRAKKAAEDIVGTVSRKTERGGKSPFQPAQGLTVEGQIGFLSGDILRSLADSGATATDKLIRSMMQRKNSQAMVHAALGWLAREDKITFSPDGGALSLK